MVSTRDEFSSNTIRTLQERVANRCSNPHCRASTSGPSTQSQKAIRIGQAAHTCAASRGGKRYDAALSSEERSSIENGIWLCASCARLIDTDAEQFSVELLDQWKFAAEHEALQNLGALPVSSLLCTWSCGHCCQPVPDEATICPNCFARVIWGSTPEEKVLDFQKFAVTCLGIIFGLGFVAPVVINQYFQTHLNHIFTLLPMPVMAGIAVLTVFCARQFVNRRSAAKNPNGPRFFR